MKITITFPAFKKWKNSRKIKLTRYEAMAISAMLEQHRIDLFGEAWEQSQVRKFENILDSQLFGKVKVDGEWVKA